MKRSVTALAALLSLSVGLSLISCAGAGDDFSAPGSSTPTATGSGTPAPVSWANTVYPILTGSCAISSSCHLSGATAPTGIVGLGGAGSSAGAAFTSATTTTGVVVQSATAATAETSMLLCKPSGGSTCPAGSPGGTTHLGGTDSGFSSPTDTNYAIILNWIEQGAQNN